MADFKLRPAHEKFLRKLDTGEYAYRHTNFWAFESSRQMYFDPFINELIEAGYVVRDDWTDANGTEQRLIRTEKAWRDVKPDTSDTPPYNPHFVSWMRIRAELHGYTLGKFIDDDELEPEAQAEQPKPLSIKEEWEKYQNTEFASWAERKAEIDRIKTLLQPYLPTEDDEESEDESEENEGVCECCGSSGTIYVPRFSSWHGLMEVPVQCSCTFPTPIPYNVRMLAIEALSGLNWV